VTDMVKKERRAYWENMADEELLEKIRYCYQGPDVREIAAREAIARIFEKVVLGKR